METIAYVRISTDGQEEGQGLGVQRQHIAAYAAAQGLSVDRWLQDVESGAKESRPGLAELRRLVAEQKVSQVLVYRLDRLARDVLLAEQLHRELSRGARVVSVTEHFGEGFTGNLMRQILAAFAEYERAVIAARLKGGRREAARTRGSFSGGPGVLGYRPIGTKGEPGRGVLQAVEREAEAVRRAFALRAEGLSLRAIAQTLDAEGFRTMRGACFRAAQVQRVLAREAFYRADQVLARSYEAGGGHAPIVDPPPVNV